MSKKKLGQAANLAQKTEPISCSSLPVPAGSASLFTPDLLAVAKIVQRARKYAPEPGAMVVMADGREVAL